MNLDVALGVALDALRKFHLAELQLELLNFGLRLRVLELLEDLDDLNIHVLLRMTSL